MGFEVLDTDLAVESAGIDAGYALDDKTLRAPDVSVGNVPDAPGWIQGVPPLALEYAGTGQDEDDLQRKITDLLAAGTRWIWVVRLVGPRRVEVYEPEHAVRIAGPGEELRAPGILQNAVPIEALFDRRVAHEMTLRNLLQRQGYQSLDEVRAEAHREGLIEAIEAVCALLALPLDEARRAELGRLDATGLRALLTQLRTDRRWP